MDLLGNHVSRSIGPRLRRLEETIGSSGQDRVNLSFSRVEPNLTSPGQRGQPPAAAVLNSQSDRWAESSESSLERRSGGAVAFFLLDCLICFGF